MTIRSFIGFTALISFIALSVSCENPINQKQAYSVNYDGNGQDSGSAPIDSTKYEPGMSVSVLSNSGNLAKEGLLFNGWNTSSDGQGVTYQATKSFAMGLQDVTLYALWVDNSRYSITYYANGASAGTVPTDSATYLTGDSFTVPGNPGGLSRGGFLFAGWNTSSNGDGIRYPGNTAATVGTADIKLYAEWVAAYSVIYHANSAAAAGTPPVDSTGYRAGDVAAISSDTGTLIQTGYNLAGWNSMSDGSGTSYAPGAALTVQVGNADLYAVWIPSSLAFSSSGNSIVLTGPVTTAPSTLIVPGGVTEIGTWAFDQESVSTVFLPNGLKVIGDYAFRYCPLTAVTIPQTVTTIKGQAFADTSLTSVHIPASVTSLASSAFQYGAGPAITVDPTNSHYSSDADGVLFDKGKTVLYLAYTATGSYAVPSTVKTIGSQAFEGSALTAISLPAGLTSIGYRAFYQSHLAGIVLPAGMTTIAVSAFAYAPYLHSITIPASIAAISSNAFDNTPIQNITMLSATPPTLSASVFGADSIAAKAATVTVHVPSAAAVTAYQAAVNWSSFGSSIVTP